MKLAARTIGTGWVSCVTALMTCGLMGCGSTPTSIAGGGGATDGGFKRPGSISCPDPVADAGPDLTVDEGTQVLLDGSESCGPGGTKYMWAQTGGPMVVLDDASTTAPGFEAPQVDQDTPLAFRISVRQGNRLVDDWVDVLVRDISSPVAADCPVTFTVAVADDVAADPIEGPSPLALLLTAESIDGSPLPEGTYTWMTDDVGESGPVRTHSVITRNISAVGTHTVGLLLVLAGTTTPLGCVASQSGDPQITVIVDEPGLESSCVSDVDCDDGAFCNGRERCLAGLCLSGIEPCSAQECDEATATCQQCQFDADCDDGLFCNGSESCVDGTCQADGSPCAPLGCDDAIDSCVQCESDADCDDLLFCTGAESCVAGSCTSADNPCSGGGVCDEASDTCQTGCGSDADCDDGLFCSGAESCVNGTCASTGDPCSGSGQGCDEATDSRLPDCVIDADCEDGLFCNGTESCTAGVCSSSGDPCPAGQSCDEQADQCVLGIGISGLVSNYNGALFEGVNLAFTGSGSSTGTDFTTATAADGSYLQLVPNGWSGTAMSDANYRLTPASNNYPNVIAAVAGEDYTAFRNYYVDDDGPQQPGYDPAAMLGTINRPYVTIQIAANIVDPGDTVLVKAGTYTEAVKVTRSGTPNNRIELKTFQNQQVTIDAEGVRSWCLMIGDKSSSSHTSGRKGNYITGDGFGMIGQSGTQDGGGAALMMWHAASPIARNLSIHNNVIGAFVRGETTDAIVEQNHVYDNGSIGISVREYIGSGSNQVKVHPTDCITRYCYVHENGLGNPEDGDGIVYFDTLRGEIAHNILWGNVDDGVDVPKGSTDCVIHHNLAFGHDPGNDPDGDGNGIKISTAGGGNHTIHHNIVFCNTRAGFDQDISDGEPGNYFYNNSAFGNSRNGLLLDAGGGVGVEAVAMNNIVAFNGLGGPYSPATDYQASGSNPIDESDYNFIADGEFPTLEGVNSRAADGTLSDPLFIDPYIKDWSTGVIANSQGALDTSWQGTLATTMDSIRSQVERAFAIQTVAGGFAEDSPCRNAGVEVPTVTGGFFGPAPDIGALESQP